MNNPTINSYQFGQIIIDGERYLKDVIISPGGVKSNWRRKEGHSLCMQDLEEILAVSPTTLILGTGSYGQVKISKSVIDKLESAGIHIIVNRTKEACEIYNQLSNENKVFAALHLTC